MKKQTMRAVALALGCAGLVACQPAEPPNPQACRTENRTVRVAVEAFGAEHGREPDSMDEIGHLLRDPSTTWWTVGAAGTVTAKPGLQLPPGCP